MLKRNLSVDESPSCVNAGNVRCAGCAEQNLYGENVKMVRNIARKSKYLTPEEKDELVKKFENGATMTALAQLYGCHHTTIGRVLRKMGVTIRVRTQ